MISFSDAELHAVCAAAYQIKYEDRPRFMAYLGDELQQYTVIGEGTVGRAIAAAVRTIRRNPMEPVPGLRT